jgi:hypothetical protein
MKMEKFAFTFLLVGISLVTLQVDTFIAGSNAQGKEFVCTEYRARLSNQSAKDAATDVPSWAKGEKPCKSPNFENGNAFAKRLMDAKYPGQQHDTGPASEYSKIKKFGDRAFE